MPTDSNSTEAVPAASGPPVAPPTVSEIVADEVADIAVDDPERAAQFVAAVSPTPSNAVPGPTTSTTAPSPSGPTAARQALPGAIVGILLLQGVVNGRLKRLALSLVGTALVAAFVADRRA